MVQAVETGIIASEGEAAEKPSLAELAARIARREPYSGPPVADVVRDGRRDR